MTGINPVGSYIDPAWASQNGTLYKTNIDNSILAGKRFTDMFSPHEVNQPIETFVPGDVNTGTDKITLTGTGLIDDMAVILTNDQGTPDPPEPLVHGVTYFVINQATNDIELSATQGGTAIDITDIGTGINTLSPAPSMIVTINPGSVWNGITLIEVAIQNTSTIVAPSADPRIDRITVNSRTGIHTHTVGVEAPSPTPPTIPFNDIPVAQIFLITSTTAISNTLITDERIQSQNVTSAVDIIVGSSGQVATSVATHTINDFAASLSDYDQVLILNGIHTQTGAIDITETGVRFRKESQQAIINGSTHTFTISGNENEIDVRMDNMGNAELILSGNHNEFKGWFTNAGATPISDTGIGNTFTEYLVS